MLLRNLVESRSHPDLNLRESPLDQLERLRAVHGEDLFITFTQGFGKNRLPKIGIKPRTKFETPMGVYCYYVDAVIDFTKGQREQQMKWGDISGGLEAPFTGDYAWHNAIVFKADTTHALTKKMTIGEYVNGIEALRAMWKPELGDFTKFIMEAESTATEKKRIFYFWNETRLLSMKLTEGKHKRFLSHPNVGMWNKILRACGYTMAIDTGDAWIHENEAEQCVIFDPSIIKVVDVIKRAEGTERLLYDLTKRVKSDPQVITKIPDQIIPRLSSVVAGDIIALYLEDFGEKAVAQNFIDKLNPIAKAAIEERFADELSWSP